MMRSNDPFEAQLARAPLRAPAPEWRDIILAAAQAAAPKEKSFTLPEWINFILNPRPASWAALAAIWILAFVFNAQTSDKTQLISVAKNSEPISEILQERQRVLATVFEPAKNVAAPLPRKRVPGPQGRAPITLIFV